MRIWPAAVTVTVLAAVAVPLARANKLTDDERVELLRGLTAEYATVKAYLPRSKKPLPFESTGTYDKSEWEKIGRKYGPAARLGDLVQITKVTLEDDKIVLEINHGLKSGTKWYQRIQVGMGPQMTPVAVGDSNATSGTNLEILFHKPLASLTSAEIKKMLSPVLDFNKRSATELYAQSLPPAIQKAIKEKRAEKGMNRDQVLLALGRPDHKSRETHDGMELEYWVFGKPPGKIVFVTFNGDKVIQVKEEFAGLGTEVADPKVPR